MVKEENTSSGATSITPWSFCHKVSAEDQRMEIISGNPDKLEITVLSIYRDKATPEVIGAIEKKSNEAFKILQMEPSCDTKDQLELRAAINKDTGAQAVYFSNKNGRHQLVVSSVKFEVYPYGKF